MDKTNTGQDYCGGKTEDGNIDDFSPTIQNAYIPLAGTTLVLEFDQPMTNVASPTGFTITTNTISSTAISGNTITFTLGTLSTFGQVVTLAYVTGNISNTNNIQLLAFSGLAVFNKMTRPTLVSAIVPAAGTTCTLTFSTTTSPMKPATGATGFTFSTSAITSTAASGFTHVLTLTTTVLSSDSPTLNYTPGNVTGGNIAALAAFSGFVVTNNSIQ